MSTDRRDHGDGAQRSLADYISVLRRRGGLLSAVAAIAFGASLAVAFALPSVYRSTGTILIEQQEIPQELVRSTVTSYADQRIQLISQSVMTTANLLEIVRKYDLYVDERATTPIETVLEKMREDIVVEMVSADVVDPRSGKTTKATIAFTIAYDSRSPDLAQKVANELASLYLNENLKSRAQAAATTASFLTGESDKLGARVRELEKRLAEFKQGNVEKLPELTQLNMQLMDRAEREMLDVEQQIRSAEQSALFLEAQLATLDPKEEVPRSTMLTSAGKRVLQPEEQLALLQSEYASLTAVYSADHPDVIRARKEIAAVAGLVDGGDRRQGLQAQLDQVRTELATARQRYSDEHPDVVRLQRTVSRLDEEIRGLPSTAAPATSAPSNPAYVQTRARLEAERTDLNTLRERHDGLRAKLVELEERLTAVPQIEREYRDLNREYENALRDYEEVRSKRTEAQLGETMETERKAERFTLIEPPLLPEKPQSPNRLAIAFLGLILAGGTGVGSAALAEGLDTSVHGARGVIALLGVPPLAAIPPIESPADRRRRWLKRLFVALLLLVAAAALTLAIHVFVTPLDVAWYTVLRRLGV